jgi:quercetin dioxygenase-like cupin family protein
MNSPKGNQHDHAELAALVSLYALRALPPPEMAAMEAHISTCAACRQEMRALGPVIDSFISWPTDVLRPSASLQERLAQRIAAETGADPVMPAPQGWTEPEWSEVAPGISCKLLATDAENNRVSMLVRLAPRTAYPPHRHAGVEELHLLNGELWIEERLLRPGDYNLGQPGGVDQRVYSETGCTCVLITSFHDVIL